MSPSRLFILRPVATTLLMVGVLLVGWVAFMQLPVSALPEVDYPTIQVVTFYPGADPDVMASSVTAPLERQFGQVPGLSQMTSTSSFGSSVITLQFGLDQNIDVEEQQVQAAINAGSTYLPTDLPNPPIYNKVNPADAPILDAGADFGFAAAVEGRRSRRHFAGAEDFATAGRGAGFDQRRAEAGGADSGESDGAGFVRAEPGRSAHGAGAGERRSGQGRDRRAAAVVHDRRQRSAVFQRPVQTDRGRLSQRRAGAAERRGQRHRRHGKHPAGRLDESDAGGDREHPAPARRQHHQRGRPHQEAAAAVAGVAAAARSRCRFSPTGPPPFAPRSKTWSSN